VSVDPLVLAPTEKYLITPKFAHPYAYAAHTPLIYFDPDGRQLFFIGVKGSASVLVGISLSMGAFYENWKEAGLYATVAIANTSVVGASVGGEIGYSKSREEFKERDMFAGGGLSLPGWAVGADLSWADRGGLCPAGFSISGSVGPGFSFIPGAYGEIGVSHTFLSESREIKELVGDVSKYITQKLEAKNKMTPEMKKAFQEKLEKLPEKLKPEEAINRVFKALTESTSLKVTEKDVDEIDLGTKI
jgi:hypothetical protein